MSSEPGAALVDVRTAAEWSYVGLPDLSAIGAPLLRVEWQSFPSGAVNPAFVETLDAALEARRASAATRRSSSSAARARGAPPRRRR